jgi:hypothetical protein
VLRSRQPDPLLLIPHSATPERPRGARINLVLLHEVFQWTHFSSLHLPGSQRAPGDALFLRADPVFLIPFHARHRLGSVLLYEWAAFAAT